MTDVLNVKHIYEHDGEHFEQRLNEALRDIIQGGGVVGDIQYVSDSATSENPRGGFGALVIWEMQSSDGS